MAPGETINFHVWIQGADPSNPAPFTLEIKREEDVQISIVVLSGSSYEQPTNSNPSVNGCGWQPSLAWVVPDIKSGAYRAIFTCSSGSTYLIFFVKAANPGVNSKILFVGSVTTWEAYNSWGGKSLYAGEDGSFESRARKVSFNRPPRIWDFDRWEIPLIQWFYRSRNQGQLPSNMEMEFCSSVDLHANPDLVNNYKLVLSVGHDEYWSWEMRDTIENFISPVINGNIAFFSGNVSWWQVRFEAQDDVSNRLLVCYKDFDEDHNEDPGVPLDHITINWIEKVINRPENLMTGASYYYGNAYWASFSANTAYKVRIQKHWLLKGTGLAFDDAFGSSLFDYFETDAADFADLDRKFPIPTGKLAHDSDDFTAPKDLMIVAGADLTYLGDESYAQQTLGYWSGPNFHSGRATMGIYRKRNGGFVFHCGNYNWAYNGLSGSWNQFSQITKNILEILSTDFVPQAMVLINSDFETGNLNGWEQTGSGTASISTPGYQSNNCAFIDASSSETYLSQKYIPVRTNRNYRVRCFAKPGSMGVLSDKSITIRLQTLDLYNNPVQEFIVAAYPISGTDWQEISAQGMISNTDDIMLQVRVKLQASTGQSAYFDTIYVEEL